MGGVSRQRQPEQLPSGRWRGWTWNAAAQRKGPTKTFDTWAQADAWMRAEERRMDGSYENAGIPVERQGRPRTFAAYADEWAKSQGGEYNTRQNRGMHARALAARWPTEMVGDIDRPAVRYYIAELERTDYSASTRSGRLRTLRAIMTDAIEDGLRMDDPTRGIRPPRKVTKRPHRVLQPDELELMLALLPDFLRAAVLLSHDSGLRMGEVAGLQWHNVHLTDPSPHVVVADVLLANGEPRSYPKGKVVLPVPLTPRTVDALALHQVHYPGAPQSRVILEPKRGLDRTKLDRIKHLWQQARGRAGLDYPLPRWHDLRHGCAHALRDAGTPPEVIQAVLRHADLSATSTYMPKVQMAESRGWMLRAVPGGAAGGPAPAGGVPLTAVVGG